MISLVATSFGFCNLYLLTFVISLIPHRVHGGGLPGNGTFLFHQAHFHWGSKDHFGSEHSRSSVSFPLEVQLIHYNQKYPNIQKAMNMPDGLAIFATFFKVNILIESLQKLVFKLRYLTGSGYVGYLSFNEILLLKRIFNELDACPSISARFPQ